MQQSQDAMQRSQEEMMLAMTEERDEHARRKCLSICTMDEPTCQTLLHALKLHVKSLPICEPPQPTKAITIPGFVWDKRLAELEQAKESKAYLDDHFGPLLKPNKLCFLVCGQAGNNLLNIKDARLPFDLSGGPDVLVLKDLGGDATARNAHHLDDARLVIELKKDLDDGDHYAQHEAQAITKLVAAHLRARGTSPMVLLTDLNDKWHFLWLSEDPAICKVELKQPVSALRFLEANVVHRDLNVRIPLGCALQLSKRGDLDAMLPPLSDEDDGAVLGEMIERYHAIASELGPDMSMAREIGRQVVKQMPAFKSLYT